MQTNKSHHMSSADFEVLTKQRSCSCKLKNTHACNYVWHNVKDYAEDKFLKDTNTKTHTHTHTQIYVTHNTLLLSHFPASPKST